ncbi:MAG: PadR family transcriptional regulator [Phycisphaeraceae bacterium]
MQTDATARRDLFRSSTHILILAILTDGPAHGYAIQRELKRTLSQSLSDSSLYPLLNKLETQGHIAATPTTHNGRPRKVYHLTAQGQQHLRKSTAHWQATIAQLQSVILPAVRRVATKTNSQAD